MVKWLVFGKEEYMRKKGIFLLREVVVISQRECPEVFMESRL